MNRFLKLSLSALVAASVSACSSLEPNLIPGSTASITPLITSSGKVARAPDGSQPIAGTAAGGTKTLLPVDSLSASAATGAIEQIFQTDRCNDLSRGGFVWFTDTVGFNDWLSPLSPEQQAQVKSRVDFSQQGVLLIDYGIAGTGGAGTTVMSKGLELKGSEAIVKIKRYEPSPTDKKKRAQVVSHPCSLHAMPRGGFNTLVVHSELGDRLTSFANTAR